MRLARGPDVWLTAAAMACVVLAGRSTSAIAYGRLNNVIAELLADDEEHRTLLAERVRLPAAAVPQRLRATFADDPDDVRALCALFALRRGSGDDRYSRAALDLSLLVLNTAIACRAYKRVAVHVALAVRLIRLENEKVRYEDVLAAVADVLPYNVDVLSDAGGGGTRSADLLRLYRRVAGGGSPRDRAAVGPDELALADHLKTLTATIGSSCKVAAMSDYFAELGLLDAAARPSDVVTDRDAIADDVPESDVLAMMTRNQEAIRKFHERMKPFWMMSLLAWRDVLKPPPPPAADD